MTPPFDSSLQLHQRLFCLGFPSFPSKRKSKAGVGGWVGNLYVWCRKVLRDVLTRVRSSQENAGSRIRLRGTPLGTEGAGATETALLREGGDQEGMRVGVCARAHACGHQMGLSGRCELSQGKGGPAGSLRNANSHQLSESPSPGTAVCHLLPPEPSEVASSGFRG